MAYHFNVFTSGDYRFWFRIMSDNASDDSFYWRVDGGSWMVENGRYGIGSWFATDDAQVDALALGDHVLEIAYRENGTRLDKFVIQLDSLAGPSGDGPVENFLERETTAPAAPTGLQAVPISDSGIELSWIASAGASSYEVGRSTSSGTPYTPIASGVTSTDFSDSGLNAYTTYYYVVRAANNSGKSADSSEAFATTEPAPISDEEVRQSVLSFDSSDPAVEVTDLGMTIELSVLGHLYQIQYAPDLSPESWEDLGDVQPGNGDLLEFVVPIPDTSPQKMFFRIKITR